MTDHLNKNIWHSNLRIRIWKFLDAKKKIFIKIQPNLPDTNLISGFIYNIVWTTLILEYFTFDYQLVRFRLRTKLRTG